MPCEVDRVGSLITQFSVSSKYTLIFTWNERFGGDGVKAELKFIKALQAITWVRVMVED